MSPTAIKTTLIDGDVSIGRNLALGGIFTVQGDALFKSDVYVDGWLRARYLKLTDDGFEQLLADLGVESLISEAIEELDVDNKISDAISDAFDSWTGGSSGDGSGDSSLSDFYLSKTTADTAAGHITFNDGITVDDIKSSGYQEAIGQGFDFHTDADGRGIGSINKLTVEELITLVLTYRKIQAIGGELIVSKAWAKVTRFTVSDSGVVRIYYKPAFGLQMWKVGYQAYMVNAGRMFWGAVTAISELVEAEEHWFECDAQEKNVDYKGSKNFKENDEFVLRGSRRDDDLSAQNFLVISAITDTPTIISYSLVDSFTINDNNINYKFADKVIIKKATGNVNLAEDLDRIEGLVDTDTTEYIYTTIATNDQDDLPELTNSATVDMYIPNGWYDNMQGVTAELPYQFRATRNKADGSWGDFGDVILNNSMGIDGTPGVDGRSPADIYKVAKTKPSKPTSLAYPPSGWSTIRESASGSATINISYTTSTESTYDKLTITDNLGNTWVDGVSGSKTGSVIITLSQSAIITVKYTKDTSQSSGDDNVKFKVTSYSGATLAYTTNQWSLSGGYYVSNDIGDSQSTSMEISAIVAQPLIWACQGVWGSSSSAVASWGDVVQWSGSTGATGATGAPGADGVVPEGTLDSLKDDLAQKMGYTGGYDDLVEAAQNGETIISGGHLQTSLIEANAIVASQINGEGLTATNATITGTITAKNGKIGGFDIIASTGTLTQGASLLPKINNVFFDFMKLGFTETRDSVYMTKVTTCNYCLKDATGTRYVYLDAEPVPQIGVISSNSFIFFLLVESNDWMLSRPSNTLHTLVYSDGAVAPGSVEQVRLNKGLNILVYNELTYTWFLTRSN